MKKKSQPAPAKKKLDAAGEKDVIELITSGTGYRAIAARYGVSVGTLHAWINATPERSHACACASVLAAHAEDDAALDEIAGAKDTFELAKARELAIHRRWRAKSLNPKKYGDKVDITAAVTVQELSEEQLQAKAKALADKLGLSVSPVGMQKTRAKTSE